MTNLENLNEESRDMSLENLTDEQASDAIRFSPELSGGKMERTEYIKNLAKNADIDAIKKVITEQNFDLLDEKETLMNNYGFTEEEIEEGVAYLEEVRTNPDMLESDIENDVAGPILIIIAAIVIGVGASSCSYIKKEERAYEQEQRRNDRQDRREDRQERREERRENRQERIDEARDAVEDRIDDRYERRDERRENRQDRRDERRENRQERREERRENRQERREDRQDRRYDRRENRRNNRR